MILHFILPKTRKGIGCMRILDFGCGEGILSDTFRCNRNIRYVGLDHDFSRIDFAKKINRGAYFITCNERLSFKNKVFDFIILNNVLHHMPREKIAVLISEIKRTLDENGKIIIIELTPSSQQRGFLFRLVTYLEEKINKIIYCDDVFFEIFFNSEFIKIYSKKIGFNFIFSAFSKPVEAPRL
ncbi:MAG: class I SAM-dependent methyltransferase [Candidatus Omnitrophica bacterium]|nr:class I SAM-dependent methyltransferase [Candidatus Omnitrophota bacterium]